jgi:hypothetical protein
MTTEKPPEKPTLTFKQGVSCIGVAIGVLIHTPIWYWLIYQVLIRVDATPTMWIFYWIYLPAGIVLALLRVITDGLLVEKK